MKLYRSLIYREWKLTRKRYIITLLLIILMGVLVMLPFILGLEENDPEESVEEATAVATIFSMVVTVTGGVAAGTNNGVNKADISANWKRYSYALPTTSKQQAAADLMVKSAFTIFVGILCLGFSFLLQGFTGCSVWSPTLTVYLAISAAAFLLDAFYSIIILRSKDEKELKKNVIVGFFASALILRIVSLFFGGDPHENQFLKDDGLDLAEVSRLMDKLGSPAALIITAALLIASGIVYYRAVWKSYERREP